MPSENRILQKMLERLYSALLNGPSLNCRPHSSRQRVDVMQLAGLGDASPEMVLRTLLGDEREITLKAKLAMPKGMPTGGRFGREKSTEPETLTAEQRAARQAYSDQQSVLAKLRTIAEDARTYENDTGVHVLQLGFPLLSLPPGSRGQQTRRIIAPLAFVSLAVTLKSGPSSGVTLECRSEGADLVVPNIGLLAWLEQQSGQAAGELDADETGEKPWAEIVAIAKRVCEMAAVPLPAMFAGETMPDGFKLAPAPKADADEAGAVVLPSAVLGLYPMANQGLLRDMQAMNAGEPMSGPIESFIKATVALDAPPPIEADAPLEKRKRDVSQERLITAADPCQARAVRLAKTSRGLVVHGPPGTGKSQTIANVIGDHLGRGERVLFVCDKRTALDVVMNRLESLGIGDLCAVVHDPQRDQRELYKSIRAQLDTMAELKTTASAAGKLEKLDAELQGLHDELTQYHTALMIAPTKEARSFHELMGKWLAAPAAQIGAKLLEGAGEIDGLLQKIGDLTTRAAAAKYASNAWADAAGVTLEQFLGASVPQWRSELDTIVAAAHALDTATPAATLPLPAGGDLATIVAARSELATLLESAIAQSPGALRATWASADAGRVASASAVIREAGELAEKAKAAPLDAELWAHAREAIPSMRQIGESIATLDSFVEASKSVMSFLAFGAKSNAAKVLAPYGLTRSPDNATKLSQFFKSLKSRLLLRDALTRLAPSSETMPLTDESLLGSLAQHAAIVTLLTKLQSPQLSDLRERIGAALSSGDASLATQLRSGGERVAAVAAFEKSMGGKLISPSAKAKLLAAARAGKSLGSTASLLAGNFDSLENIVRVRDGLAALPPPVAAAASQLIRQSLSGPEAIAAIAHAAVTNEIQSRLRNSPQLIGIDPQQLQSSLTRYAQLDADKKEAAKAALLHLWGERQRERVLHASGSRLSSAGAELTRRLTLRGQRAMRLRQVVAIGGAIEGGDPLFDLRPVWMASPETVAQLFPRKEMFDVVIFDEASQCRLEEALPVLLRAKRVLIAGDPQQLPPTRFFETAMASSDEDEIETDQQLFESRQGEVEDLLSAALNLEIDQSYLDVHYRSRNSDLIEFSNEHFYNSRLQPLPLHPSRRSAVSPITLYKVGGVYEQRANAAEADKVVSVVAELLKSPKPPSIGIACFNVSQRDLITEALDDLAAKDDAFAKRLAEARERRSEQSFEGLFVKNLENVQGDERDHIIISTTYGPDPAGKFYRRFGPVGAAGGGRRLNVLVTRARERVHLITSIPEIVYRALPPVPTGQTPGGAWLLFAYLNYAEKLAAAYAAAPAAAATSSPAVEVRETREPSKFAQTLATQLLAQHQIGSTVHWGNAGFCIDLALHDPKQPGGVTLGVLCDMNRFAQAADPVEWEVFRTGILTNGGWTLERVWTPHFFRDPQKATSQIVERAKTVKPEA